jgi:hypothetical protein
MLYLYSFFPIIMDCFPTLNQFRINDDFDADVVIKTSKDRQKLFIYFFLAVYISCRKPYAHRMLFNSNNSCKASIIEKCWNTITLVNYMNTWIFWIYLCNLVSFCHCYVCQSWLWAKVIVYLVSLNPGRSIFLQYSSIIIQDISILGNW